MPFKKVDVKQEIENKKQTDEAFKKAITELENERYLKVRKIFKEDFDIDLIKENGECKTFYEVLEELSKVWNK